MASQLQCPWCGSTQIDRLARNDISPFRGYRCQNCQRRLRDRGSLFVYLVVLVIGLFFSVALATMPGEQIGQKPVRSLILLGVSLSCLIYSALELMRATPRRLKTLDTNTYSGWYYARSGAKFGPFPFNEICRLIESRELRVDDMLLDPRTGNWIPVSEIPKSIPPIPKVEQPSTKPPATVVPPSIQAPRTIRRPKLLLLIVLSVALMSILGPIIVVWRAFQSPPARLP